MIADRQSTRERRKPCHPRNPWRESYSPGVVKKNLLQILIYGLCGGVLIVVLKLIEFRFLVVEHSLEIYGGLVAALFAALGIWLGLKLTRTRVVVREIPVPANQPFTVNTASVERLGLTPRELEILQLIAEG